MYLIIFTKNRSKGYDTAVCTHMYIYYKQIIYIYTHLTGIWIILDQTMVWTITQSIIIAAGFTGAKNPPDYYYAWYRDTGFLVKKKKPRWKTTVNTSINP